MSSETILTLSMTKLARSVVNWKQFWTHTLSKSVTSKKYSGITMGPLKILSLGLDAKTPNPGDWFKLS